MCNMDHRSFGERPDPRKMAEAMRTAAADMLSMVQGLELVPLNGEDRERVKRAKAVAQQVRDTNLLAMDEDALAQLGQKLFSHGMALSNIIQHRINIVRNQDR